MILLTGNLDQKLNFTRKMKQRQKKKIDDDAISETYYVIVMLLIYVKFRAMRKPDCGRLVCKI